MTSLPFFQVDAFADRPLTGNPAAVMPLERWLDDALMQAIAAENNLSETAFTVPSDSEDADFDLRWFTPDGGSGAVRPCDPRFRAHPDDRRSRCILRPNRARLIVSRRDDLLELDMRAANLTEVREPELCAALGLAGQPGMARRRLQRRGDHRGRRRGGGARRQAGLRGTWADPPNAGRHRAQAISRTSPAACSCPTSASTKTR